MKESIISVLDLYKEGSVSPDDAEFELGIFAKPRELQEGEEKLGLMK